MLFNYDRCRKYATTNSVDNITLPSPHSPSRCITRFLYKFCFHEKITANLIDVLSLAKSMCSYKVANSTLIICIKVMVLLHLILKLFSLHYTYVSACMYVCMYVGVYVCMYVYMYICVCLYVCIYMYMYVFMFICTAVSRKWKRSLKHGVCKPLVSIVIKIYVKWGGVQQEEEFCGGFVPLSIFYQKNQPKSSYDV